MKRYYFYSRIDKQQEPIAHTLAFSRCKAAEHFAKVKQMPLKAFLSVFAVSR